MNSTVLTTAVHDRARDAYLVIFDAFAASKSDIAEELGLTVGQVTTALRHLTAAGLVVSDDVNGESQGNARRGQYKEIVWQAIPTYDDITREEAEALFASKYGDPTHREAEALFASKTTTKETNPMPTTPKSETTTPKPATKQEAPEVLVAQVAKATRLRGATVEMRQKGARPVILFEGRILAYVSPLKRGGFRVIVQDYGSERAVTVADVKAAAEAVKTSARRAPKAKKPAAAAATTTPAAEKA